MAGIQDHGNGDESLGPLGVSRRCRVDDVETRAVTFAKRTLSEETLRELRRFLANASAEEVATIRMLYGDMPDVLQWIARELSSPSAVS